MDLGPIDYASTTPPAGYRCTTCGAQGCKLWREYQTFLEHQSLACCDCAAKEQQRDVSTINADGWVLRDGMSTDTIGWRVPAVPTEDGSTFWGYAAVPHAGRTTRRTCARAKTGRPCRTSRRPC